MVDILPMYNKFRAPSMTMVIVQMILPMIGIWGVHQLIKRKNQINELMVIIPVGAFTLLLLFFLISPTSLFTFLSNNELISLSSGASSSYLELMDMIQEYRIDLFKDEIKRSLFFVVLLGGTLIMFTKRTFDSKILIGIIGVLVIADLWVVDQRIQNNEKIDGAKEYKYCRKREK